MSERDGSGGEIRGRYATYKVTETVDENGFVTISFSMDPRPAKYAEEIWSWTGRMDALPPREES